MKRTVFSFFERTLPILFWILLLFGFEGTRGALASLFAAGIHEGGHFLALALILRRRKKNGGTTSGRATLRATLTGFRIRPSGILTYREDIVLSLGGPVANLVSAALFLPFPALRFCGGMHLFCAFSNLMPIRGYDGARVLSALGALRGGRAAVPEAISFFLSALLVFLSLFLIDKAGSGLWIFALLFVSLLGAMRRGLADKK